MRKRMAMVASALFCSGMAVGYAAQKNDPSTYRGKSREDAAKVLLEKARMQAGDGSWERIGVGRVYYLGGMKSDGEAIFDQVLAHKPAASDVFRIARIYREGGDWPKAKALFDRYVSENPDDASEIAQVGAYYLLNGDRAAAESLFDRSFQAGDELWATISAAGAYLGVLPQE